MNIKKNQNMEIEKINLNEIKQQPQSQDLEAVVLGAILQDKDAIVDVSTILKIESFYNPKHQIVFDAMLQLYAEFNPIDILTVTEKTISMGQDKAVTAYDIVELTNRVASAANVEYHCRIIQQKWIKRKSLENAHDTIVKCYDDTFDCFEILNKQELELNDINDTILTGKTDTNLSLANELLDDIERVSSSTDKILGVRLFGITELDEALDGGENDDLIVIAARPGMGKSSLFNSAAVNAIRENEAVLIWSAEMSKVNQVARIISALADIDYGRMRRGELEDYEIKKRDAAIDLFIQSKVIIKDKAGVNSIELRSEIIAMKRKYAIKAAFFDRIEKLSPISNEDDRRRISFATGLLKRTAQEVGIPIIIAAQLNREVEKESDKRPQLSHLRNSGSLEEDATKVVFIYRPEYYDFMETADGLDTAGLGEMIIAKNRNKETGSVNTKFNGKCMVYENLIQKDTDFDFLDNEKGSHVEDNINLRRVDTSSNNIIPF